MTIAQAQADIIRQARSGNHDYERMLAAQLEHCGCMPPVFEYRFAPPRKWRADLAYVQQRILIEIEGGRWNGGRHTRPKGYEADLEKYNAAVIAGFKVLRYTPEQVKNWTAAQEIATVLLGRDVIIG